MKRSNLPLLLLILALLSGLAIFYLYNNKSGTLKKELRDFAVSDTASINKIFLADKKGNAVTLERQPVGYWTVNGKYIARKDALQLLLHTVKSIDVYAPVAKAAYNNIIASLAAQGVKVEIYKNNELEKIYYVGGPTQDYLGTYMMLENSSTPFAMYIPGFNGYLTTRYFTDQYLWRAPIIFNYAPSDIANVKVEFFTRPEENFEISNNNGSISINSATGNSGFIDSSRVNEYLNSFRNVNYEAYLSEIRKELKDSVLTLPPLHRVSVTDKNGKTSILTGYPKKPKPGDVDIKGNPRPMDMDRFYGKLNDEKELVLVQYFVYDRVLKPRSWFLGKKNVKNL